MILNIIKKSWFPFRKIRLSDLIEICQSEKLFLPWLYGFISGFLNYSLRFLNSWLYWEGSFRFFDFDEDGISWSILGLFNSPWFWFHLLKEPQLLGWFRGQDTLTSYVFHFKIDEVFVLNYTRLVIELLSFSFGRSKFLFLGLTGFFLIRLLSKNTTAGVVVFSLKRRIFSRMESLVFGNDFDI
jgi:hypothetical protein